MVDSDFDRVMDIARNNSYPRGHYYCDAGFDNGKVDDMCVKWVSTAFRKGDPVAIIESDGKVAGYFLFQLDDRLSDALGCKYARMRHLALDEKFRGKGLGNRLFGGSISIMKDMGAKYVDSGYASKNHASAKLHTLYSFFSVYDEVTFHLWL
ncbi:MAG: GNAT family N-acetyltransferase [Thermoplasmata archaeon]|nr:GNAT family N-acetyltransferase [Thermoplasmata archaeon]